MTDTTQPLQLLIVGGGFGGLKLALELANDSRFQITLVSDTEFFEYHAALYRTATGRSPMEVVIPLSEIVGHISNVNVVHDQLQRIEPEQHIAYGHDDSRYPYDAAVLALGQTLSYYGIQGMAEHSFSLDEVNHTIQLRRQLHSIMLDEQNAKQNFVVVGGGASGVEFAAELSFYLDKLCLHHGKPRKDVDVMLIEGSDRLLPMLRPRTSRKALARLSKLGVEVLLNRQVSGRSVDDLTTDDISLKTKTVVWTAGSRNNEFFTVDNKDEFDLGRAGRVEVDDYLQGAEDVYIIGDSADTKYSGMAQTALYDARFVAKNLRRQLRSRKLKSYRPHRPIYVVPTGGKSAVLQWGRLVLSGRLAWWLRRLADLRLFIYFEPLRKAIATWRQGNYDAEEICPICKEGENSD